MPFDLYTLLDIKLCQTVFTFQKVSQQLFYNKYLDV